MPKISEAAGPTDESQPGYYDEGRSVQSPNVTETEEGREQADRKGDDVSPGTSSSTSDDSTVRSEPSGPSSARSSAPATGGPSRKAPTERSGARSTAGPGKAGR